MDKVLIIDDEIEIAQVFGRIAQSVGYQCFVTTKPDEFLQWAQTEQPSHILMDLQMPDMDGVELLRALAASRCKAKIVLISGFDPRVVEVTANLGKEQGLTIVKALSKPILAKELTALLTELKTTLDTSPQALKTAIINEEFFLKLQPKLAVQPNKPAGFEALLRWQHPTQGLVPPDLFIPEFEKHGMFRELSDYVVRHTCKAIARLDEQGIDGAQTSINISAGDLTDLMLASRMKETCQEFKIAPQRIILEITETVAMADPVTAMDNLARIRLAGFGLSLDDFGTGFSSLAFLRSMPFNEIKIDKVFIQQARQSDSDQAIIKAIVSLGKAFKMKVVAEGCEDQATLSLLKDLGCDLVQGYYIARPLDVEDAIRFITEYGEKS